MSFLLENVIFTSAIALSLVQIARYWQPKPRSLSVLRVFILLVAIAAPILGWRYDLFPALLTLLALLSVIVRHPTLAGIFLGLGIMAKLYPVVLLPIFCLYYFASREDRGLFRLLLGCIGAICISLLPFALTAGGDILSFLRYHYQRGLQIESLPAGLISLTHVVHLTKASIVLSYGAHQIISPLAPIVQKWLPLITSLAFVGVIANCLVDFRQEYTKTGAIKTQTLVAYIVAALLTFMATGKVFSTQYIVWLLPFASLLRPKQQAVVLLIFVLTIFNYPFAYNQLKLFYTVPVLLLNLRNFLVVFLLLWLIAERKSTSANLPFMPRQPVAR